MADLVPFNTIEEYEIYQRDIHPTKVFTVAERDALSPDNIDNVAFWQECYRKFGNYIYSSANKADLYITESAMINASMLASSINAFTLFNHQLLFNHGYCKLLEIGPGLGNVYHYLSRFPLYTFDYKCYDIWYPDTCVVPQDKRIDIANVSNLAETFDVIYSINVFQHFSMLQWTSYLYNAHKMLNEYGKLIISFYYGGGSNCEDGRKYTYTFGQLTPVPDEGLYKVLNNIGFKILTETRRMDGIICLVLGKVKKEEKNVNP